VLKNSKNPRSRAIARLFGRSHGREETEFAQVPPGFVAQAGAGRPGKHVRGSREFRTRRRSKRDEPEGLALPQRLVGLLNELMTSGLDLLLSCAHRLKDQREGLVDKEDFDDSTTK
jgi:hypothetical protein